MSVSYVIESQVTEVGVLVSRPNVDLLYSDDEIIGMLDNVLRSKMVPLLMRVREEYFVTFTDYTVEQGDTTGILIPRNAIGMKLRQVAVVGNNQPQSVVSMPRLTLEQINGTFPNQPVPQGFYIQDNSIVIWPVPMAQMIIRLYWLRRPLKLTATTNCRQILSIDENANTITLSADVPSDWVAGDFSSTRSEPPFESQTITPITVNGSIMEFTDVTDYDFEAGDWIAEYGYTNISQIPVELFELQNQGACIKYQTGLVDREALNELKEEYARLQSEALDVISQRVEGINKKITTNGNGIADWAGFPGARWSR